MLRRLQELHTAHAAMGRLASEYRSMPRSPEERLPVEFTPDVAVAQRIEQIQRRARSEVLIFDVPPYVLQHLENRSELEQLAAGVRYRTVYDRRGMELPGGLERIGRYVAAGEEARAAHRLPLKLMVVDRKLGITPAAGGEAAPAAGSALIHESPLDRRADDFSIAAVHAAEQAGRPVLGICRGSQLVNLTHGGTLVPDLVDYRLHRGRPGPAAVPGRDGEPAARHAHRDAARRRRTDHRALRAPPGDD
ncbi:gamma-glutamyl-gamma-aminobutyrate hydrolase family protein [Streptomyces sp. NPDC059460]|uniref:gamma-glutamyl-gamma-aminobutyrate hydrolase family protein n=1 Tax=Streptomyces sp. NPDC059460 TaxID=3346840 RepID=UPI0036AE8612